jgi:XTP/dITP diphosphohydrolase
MDMKLVYCLVILATSLYTFPSFADEEITDWKLNTSNQGKLKEFRKIFGKYGADLHATTHDLKEVDADDLTVVIHKASQLDEHVIVDDTSLNVEGADVGVNVKWLIEHLGELIGKKACWNVLLAYREEDMVYIYQGEVMGTIVKAKGNSGFGFDPYFLPDGSKLTLAEYKPDNLNARALAVDALMSDVTLTIESTINDWKGPWQND